MKKKALLVLAEGFEEIEAAAPADILRRAGIDVVISGLIGRKVTGAHGITFETDIVFDEADFMPDVLILPGGMPGTENLSGSAELKKLILKMNDKKKLIAAICASPALVLAPAGILNGRAATCYPGLEKNFSADVKFVKNGVVQDRNVITSRGPGTAVEFGLKIAENLAGKTKADMIREQLVFA